MSEMVELVARAICKEHGGDPDHVTPAKRGTDSQTGLPYIIPALPQWRRYELDARAAIDTVSKWYPIEIAPKDGTEVLVWGGGHDVASVWWSENGVDAWFNGDVVVNPTHWMPLPKPPLEGERA